MSQVTNLISSLEDKVKQLEANIQQSVAQHHGLLGMLQASKEALVEAKKIADTVIPGTAVDEALNVAENVVNVIENVAGN